MSMMMKTSVKIFEVTLSSFGLDLQNCRGQIYDGAGAVSGQVNGRSALILRENSKALYTHCASHRSNLAIGKYAKFHVCNLMDVIKDISFLKKFFLLFEQNIYKIL